MKDKDEDSLISLNEIDSDYLQRIRKDLLIKMIN